VLGVGRYVSSAFSALEGSALSIRHRTMVFCAVHLGRYLEAAGRARAVRDCDPAAMDRLRAVAEGDALVRGVRDSAPAWWCGVRRARDSGRRG